MAPIMSAEDELSAFVAEARRGRPVAWETVETLQRACLAHQPATREGWAHALDVLRRIAPDPVVSGS